MSETLKAIGQAMTIESETLRVIAQNVANVETVAYRRQVPVIRADFDDFVSQAQGLRPPIAAGGTPVLEVAVDHSPTTMKNTGGALDVALDGEGFFVLQAAQGQLLTRRGDFQVNREGVLSSSSGEPVLGRNGMIQIGSASPTIAVDGSVSVDGVVVDRLRVAMPTDTSGLTALGDGRFYVGSEQIVQEDAPTAVRQGFLEASNVAPVNEMIFMMEALRRFETQQRLARTYDDMLGKAISELGKTT